MHDSLVSFPEVSLFMLSSASSAVLGSGRVASALDGLRGLPADPPFRIRVAIVLLSVPMSHLQELERLLTSEKPTRPSSLTIVN